jgi:hypothetical protein
MKKAFFILIIFAAFNFISPNTQVLAQTLRHKIEFTQEDKSRDVTNNEILKNKVVMYLRMNVLMLRVAVIDGRLGFNSS